MKMDKLENQLKQALTQREPPADFAAKVMARIEDQKSPWWRIFFQPAYRVALAGGLACVILAGSVTVYRRHQAYVEERRRAEAAREQLKVALRITNTQLNRV